MASLWRAVKRRSVRHRKAIRRVVDYALEAELPGSIEPLWGIRLRGELADDKLVRLPTDDNVCGRIPLGRRQVALPVDRRRNHD